MNPLRAWNRFWFGPVSARPLGVYRIVFGLLVLAHLAFISVELDYWYTDAGLLQGNQARIFAGPYRFSPLNWVQDPFSVRCAVAALAAVAIAFVLGWRTQIMGVLIYFGLMSLYHRNLATNCGPDMLMMITSFYLMLSPCCAALSLDARRAAQRRADTPAEPLCIPWAQRLLQIQLCVIYFASAVFKCNGRTWIGGTAVHYVIFNHEVGQLNLEWLARYPLVISLMTYGALLIEFALPFLLWFRPARRWVALGGILLHAGIVPLVNVPLFGEQMTSLYLLFLAPDELESLLRRLNPWAWFRRQDVGLRALSARLDPSSATAAWRQLELSFDAPEQAGSLGQAR